MIFPRENAAFHRERHGFYIEKGLGKMCDVIYENIYENLGVTPSPNQTRLSVSQENCVRPTEILSVWEKLYPPGPSIYVIILTIANLMQVTCDTG